MKSIEMAVFQRARQQLAHSTLKNTLFHRLSCPPGLWNEKSIAFSERVSVLVENWGMFRAKKGILESAKSTWIGPPSVRNSIIELWASGLVLKEWFPNEHYPSRNEMFAWIDQIEDPILLGDDIEAFLELKLSIRISFWSSAIGLVEWIDDCSIDEGDTQKMFLIR